MTSLDRSRQVILTTDGKFRSMPSLHLTQAEELLKVDHVFSCPQNLYISFEEVIPEFFLVYLPLV